MCVRGRDLMNSLGQVALSKTDKYSNLASVSEFQTTLMYTILRAETTPNGQKDAPTRAKQHYIFIRGV